MQNQILGLTKKLIIFKTVTGNREEIAACFDFIKKYFEQEIKTGKIVAKDYDKNGVLSLVLANRDALKFDIILNGHIDVVNAEEKYFTPQIKSGKLLGRGAGDMKSQVATTMILFKEFMNSDKDKSIALILNSDEEVGGKYGAGYLVKNVGYRAKIVIAPDGGNNFDLDIKEKGLFWFKISAKGKAVHGSRTWLGENAILKLVKFYKELEKIFPPLGRTKNLYQDGVSVNLGKILGGKSVNAVPDSAEMYLDIRYSEKQDRQKIIDAIKKISRKNKVSYEIIDLAEMFETDPDNPYLKKFKAIAEKKLGRKIKIIKSTGAGDNRFFSERGMPVVIMGPNFGGEHSADEWLEIKSLEKFYRILKEFLITIN